MPLNECLSLSGSNLRWRGWREAVRESVSGKDNPSWRVQWTHSAASPAGAGNQPPSVEMGRDETRTITSHTLPRHPTTFATFCSCFISCNQFLPCYLEVFKTSDTNTAGLNDSIHSCHLNPRESFISGKKANCVKLTLFFCGSPITTTAAVWDVDCIRWGSRFPHVQG